MDDISTKYIIMAVGIYITLIVLTSVILVINKVGDVFSVTNRTDISIQSRIDSIEDMYHNSVLNGVGLVNTITKYEEDATVIVDYPNKINIESAASGSGVKVSKYLKEGFTNGTIIGISIWDYNTDFDVTVSKIGSNYIITFT